MVARCAERGINAVAGTLTQANLEPSSFDLVTMTEYLEHEGDPRRVLEESRRITRAGGYLVVEIPLVSSLPARLFRNYWAQLDLPRHLMFFTEETLQRMLLECGYDVVATQTLRGMLAPSLLNALGYDGMGELTTRQLWGHTVHGNSDASAPATQPGVPLRGGSGSRYESRTAGVSAFEITGTLALPRQHAGMRARSVAWRILAALSTHKVRNQ
jgi:hypothetical protein